MLDWPISRVLAAAAKEDEMRRQAIIESAIAARAAGADGRGWTEFLKMIGI